VPQNILLFRSTTQSNGTEYCNVDALVLLGGMFKVVVKSQTGISESVDCARSAAGRFAQRGTCAN